ncbi:MAG: hypothetical protein AB8I08_16660 [Sandaracinaceae bacterium]
MSGEPVEPVASAEGAEPLELEGAEPDAAEAEATLNPPRDDERVSEPETNDAPEAATAEDRATQHDGEEGPPSTAADDAETAPTQSRSLPTRTGTESEAAVAGPSSPAPSGPALTFANSFFGFTNAVTAHTFSPDAQLTYDPTYVMNFSLTPRFYLTDTTFLWLNQAMSVELTDSNTGTYNREPLLSDTLLDLRQLLIWEGFVFQGQLRLGFPLSKASQSAGRVLQTGLGLTVARPFPELASLTFAATVGYRRWWATRNVPATGAPYPGNCTQPEPGQPPVCTQASGQTTARDILLAGLTTTIAPVPGLTVSLSAFYMAAYGHELSPADVPINGGSNTIGDDSATHWRPFTYFALAVGYDVLPWLNLQLGVQNAGVVAPLYSPDGSVRSPFTADTQVFLTTTLGLDAIVNEVTGSGEDDGLTPEERQRRRQGLARNGGNASF